MAHKGLARLNDQQLMNLFAHSVKLTLSERAKQIILELEKRGYIYDEHNRDFVTCEQWNKRHGDALRDCGETGRGVDDG